MNLSEAKGCVIRDNNHLITGIIVDEGLLSVGQKQVPVWRILILSGHRAGTESLLLKDEAEFLPVSVKKA